MNQPIRAVEAAPWLTVEEVASELQMSHRYVVDQLRAKALRGTKLGSRWRIHRADLDRYMDAKSNVRKVRR